MKNKHYTIYAAKAWRSAMLVCLLIAGSLTALHAQVNTYVFSQSTATYTEITGGTVLTSTGVEDDNTYLVSLPFSFQFNNNSYTDIYVSANGYISFGTTDPGTGTRTAISATAAVDGIAAGASRDMQGGFACAGTRTSGSNMLTALNNTDGVVVGAVISGTGIPVGTTVVNFTANSIEMSANATSTSTSGSFVIATGEIRVEDLGSEFVIQWKNYRRFGGTGANNDKVNFQIRLNPSNNNITYHYGVFTTLSTSTSTTFQIGLRGATNADFNNRTTISDWSATTPGASNSASVRYSNLVFPVNGLIYNYAPPDLCTTADGGTITPASASRCLNQSYVMSATGFSQGTGTSYQWQVSETPGGPYSDVVTGTGATTTTYNTGALTVPGVYYYVLKTTCAECGPCDDISDELVLTVNALPVVEVTPDASNICQPGASAITLTATGASTYSWSPAAGLSATTGDMVDALPSASTNYTVTGTDANGCTAQDVAAITVATGVLISSATATPPSVCSGGNSQLNVVASVPAKAKDYIFSVSSGSLDPMTGATTVLSNNDDDVSAPQSFGGGFSFIFDGVAYTDYIISPDGFIRFGATTGSNQFSNSITSTTNIPKIYAVWDDLATGMDGYVRVVMNGTAPNRIFVAEWFVLNPRITDWAITPANSTFQIWLYEGSNKIEYHYGTVANSSSASIGMSGSTPASNFISINGSTNVASTVTANNSNTVMPAAGTAYVFEQPAVSSYLWSPSDYIAGQENLSNPLATGIISNVNYSVVVSASNGCTASASVPVTVGSAIACDSISYSTACGGTNFTVNAHTSGGGGTFSYSWSDGNGGVYADAPSITANLAPGTYLFSVTVSDGCGTSCMMSQSITVNSAPGGSANGPSTGETYQDLVYIVSGYEAGSTIDWQFATALAGPYTSLAISSDTAELVASSAGTFYVQALVTGPNGCQSIAGPITTVITVDGDNVCDAIPLVVGGTVNGPYSNQGATLEPGEQSPPNAGCGTQTSWCEDADHTVWFTFVAPANGRVSLHFSPANWDSQLAVWQASSCSDLLSGAGVLIAANDDSASSPFNAYIAPVCLTPGQTYYVQVDRYGTTQINSFGLYILEHANPLTDTWYADLDGDTYGDLNNTFVQCSAPAGYVGNSTDCDDMNASVNPGATELCNAIDDNCDGNIDEGTQPGAGAISGNPTSLCWPTAPGIGSYTVPADPLATTYTWTVPAGMFITGGQGTNSITIQWTAAAANTGIVGNVTCVASNACFSGAQSVYPVSITTVKPVTPGSISGPAKVCPGDAVVYSVSSVARASFYQWTLPAGLTIVGSSTGNIINVSVDGSFVGGTMSVQAGNACGLSPNRNKGLSFNNPLVPGAISGQASGVCGNVGEVYSISSVANALSYQWSVGAGGSIPGSTSGTMVAVDYSGSLASTVLSVSSVNGCGTSAPRNLTVTGAPGVPSPITGPVSVCTGATNHYSVNTVVGATSYDWTAPGTVVFGQGTKEVDIMWGSSPSSGQQILVRASNACGDGPLRTLGGISINFCPRISGADLDAELAAYPNPATDLVTVTFNMESSFVMKLNDVTGRNVMTVNNVASGAHTELVDVSKLNSGVYFLVLQTADGSQQIRLVVE